MGGLWVVDTKALITREKCRKFVLIYVCECTMVALISLI